MGLVNRIYQCKASWPDASKSLGQNLIISEAAVPRMIRDGSVLQQNLYSLR